MTEEERNEKRMILVDWMEFYDITHGTDEDIVYSLNMVLQKQASKTQSFDDLELAPRREKEIREQYKKFLSEESKWATFGEAYPPEYEVLEWAFPYLSEEKKEKDE